MNCLKTKTVIASLVFIGVSVVIRLVEAQDIVLFDCNDVDGIQTLPGLFNAVNASVNKNEITDLHCRFRQDITGTFPERLPSLPSLTYLSVPEIMC